MTAAPPPAATRVRVPPPVESGIKFRNRTDQLLGWLSRPDSGCTVKVNPPRARPIREAEKYREVRVAQCGALATWTPEESTGRSPEDTVTVKRPENQDTIDWDSPYANPIDPAIAACRPGK